MKSTNVQSVNQSPLHQKAEKLARALLGDDMAFDFDMLISKVSLPFKKKLFRNVELNFPKWWQNLKPRKILNISINIK